MNTKFFVYILATTCAVFNSGCGARGKGKIISEHHKRSNDFYLENTSSNEIISFTIRRTEEVNSEVKYFASKKSITNIDSTNLTFIYTLAPGERKNLGNAQSYDTIKLYKDPYDKFIPSIDSAVPEGYIPPPKGIRTINRKSHFEIVGASTKE